MILTRMTTSNDWDDDTDGFADPDEEDDGFDEAEDDLDFDDIDLN